MVILQSINYPLADNLTTIGQQWKRATTMTIGLVVAIIGYIVLGSKYGMMGAAAAAYPYRNYTINRIYPLYS